MSAHVSESKKKVVAELTKRLKEESVVGVVNMQDLPAAQLQNMRKNLRGKLDLFMTKKRLMMIAIEKSGKEDLKRLEQFFDGMPALFFTKDNPFTLYKTLKKNKTPAPARAGQKAPKDIEIKAGPTSFAPGPIISELSAFGLQPGVENGKVAIKKDKVVAKEGDVIDAKLAGLLLRLGIQPMEIGLNVVAVLEDGTLYDRKTLDVDEKEILAQAVAMAQGAFNLAVEIGFPTQETTEFLITKAERQARGLAISQGILASGVVEEVLAKAERQALALKNQTT